MAALISCIFSSSTLLSMGLYHLICTTRNHLKSPRDYTAKPYHPFPPASSSSTLKHIQLYLLILYLLLALGHQLLTSSDSDPLIKGHTPVHRFSSLQSAAVLFLFLILSISLLLSSTTSLLPIPSDLFFAIASVVFFLHYYISSAAASFQISDLQAKCDSVSSWISAASALLCLLLACQPRLFIADVGFGASICLQGLWALQTGLSLYVEAFIPEGCHRLLDVVNGVEGSTKCDLEESRFRAVAILDLAFVVHVTFVLVTVIGVYAAIAKSVGLKRLGSYEALPTMSSGGGDSNHNHVQMKALAGTQA
ncbi:uncharacterized protein LOC122667883 [Telopea speciosissima]|uniref:uncharacterized protein LOC122667883 n=1 Tax=Telopea speciosissima TaxID=54955 RepID=UPI001CC6E4F5|nr:uncharacterized protein LOC122667883 [Telopea speciosissima]XP_043720284.1 uncharacterized protein LOC122667883 [Telopea speciosissima]XP_043720285.1 uncharacterized protein LOC122667883 [Telopea speciosissima]XP_043720286.1 uncharacterized protein LOC122667883 [Telopea speciosissima]